MVVRENGFYWVRLGIWSADCGRWIVAEWLKGEWWSTIKDYAMSDEHFSEIGGKLECPKE